VAPARARARAWAKVSSGSSVLREARAPGTGRRSSAACRPPPSLAQEPVGHEVESEASALERVEGGVERRARQISPLGAEVREEPRAAHRQRVVEREVEQHVVVRLPGLQERLHARHVRLSSARSVHQVLLGWKWTDA